MVPPGKAGVGEMEVMEPSSSGTGRGRDFRLEPDYSDDVCLQDLEDGVEYYFPPGNLDENQTSRDSNHLLTRAHASGSRVVGGRKRRWFNAKFTEFLNHRKDVAARQGKVKYLRHTGDEKMSSFICVYPSLPGSNMRSVTRLLNKQEQRTCVSTVPPSDMFSIGDDEQDQSACMPTAHVSDMFSLSSDEMDEQDVACSKTSAVPSLL